MSFIDANSTTLTNSTLLLPSTDRSKNTSPTSAPTLLTTPKPASTLQADSITLQGAAKTKDTQAMVNLHEGNPFIEGIHNAQESYTRNMRLAKDEQAKVTGRTTPYAIAGAVIGAATGAALGYFVGGNMQRVWQGATFGTAFGALAMGMNGYCIDKQYEGKAQGYRIAADSDQTAIQVLSKFAPK